MKEDQMEIEADDFAMELLIPTSLLYKDFPLQMNSDERTISLLEISAMSTKYKVSIPIVRSRLLKLGKKVQYMSSSFYD